MKILLFPHYVTLENVKNASPSLFAYLSTCNVSLEMMCWDGELYSLPTSEKVLVHAATQLQYAWQELAEECQRKGHLVFYGPHYIGSDGRPNSRMLLPAAIQFLTAALSPDSFSSSPISRSTLS